MMIKDYKQLMGLQHIHMEQMFLKICESEMLMVKDLFFEKLK